MTKIYALNNKEIFKKSDELLKEKICKFIKNNLTSEIIKKTYNCKVLNSKL